MGDMLSQEEIDALLNGDKTDEGENINSDSELNTNINSDSELDTQEIDALGEIGNISIGTSATTLNSLLGQKVTITTPRVMVCTWKELLDKYYELYVAVKVEYTDGLNGLNLLLLKESDVKIIADLMMGGDGSNNEGELTELHLSAISEAMNQMIGSAATSMSSMFDKRIDISPPKAFSLTIDSISPENSFDDESRVVQIAFKMQVGELIDSEMMQIIPVQIAKELVDNILNAESRQNNDHSSPVSVEPPPVQQQMPISNNHAGVQPSPQQNPYQPYGQQYVQPEPQAHNKPKTPINVQPAQFESLEDGMISIEKKNIGLIMDVPLQVTVELGRTNRLIKDILEFGPGSIIELDKLAGDPVDILVNGKVIAKGEVVVIDESFGVRITDIIDPSKRL